MIAYPAIFHKQKKGYWVEFPDISGCVTEGDTLEKAQKMAQEALTSILEVRVDYDESIRKPSRIRGKNIYFISPDIHVAIAVTLRILRKKQGLTMKTVAERMNVTIGEYQRLEDPKRSNPTVKKLYEVCSALNVPVKELF